MVSAKKSDTNVGEFIDSLSANGYMFPIVFLTFPFLLPIPIPGVSTIFGILIIAMGGSIFLGIKPWFPGFVTSRKLSEDLLRKTLERLLRWSRSLEVLFRPRWLKLAEHRYNYQFNGFIIMICGAFLLVPFPALTNLPPAINILIIAVGDIEDDGMAIGGGYLLFLLNLAFFGALLVSGKELLGL